MYETLITLGEDYNTVNPNLATHWELSDDGLVYSFKLRDDVYFHDQSKLSAWDVKNSVDRYLQNRPTWMLATIIKDVMVTDSLSFQIILEKPYSQFIYMLCSPYVFLVSKNTRPDDSTFIPLGTGPFIMENKVENKKIVLKKNIKYWRDQGQVEKISFIVQNSTQERQTALIEDEIDILYLISGYEIDRLRGKVKSSIMYLDLAVLMFFGFNHDNKPFDDIRVRQAVLHAFNLSKIVNNINRGNASVAKGPLPPAYQLKTEIAQAGYDPEKTASLLRDAGYPDGIRVKCIFPGSAIARTTIVETVKSELEKSGILIEEILTSNWTEQTDSIFSSGAQLFLDGSESLFIGEPEYFLRTLFHSESRYNFFRYKNDRVDALLEMVREEKDKSKRENAYELIVEQIVKDTPAVFYANVIPHFAYNSTKIKKMDVNPYRLVNFNRMELYE